METKILKLRSSFQHPILWRTGSKGPYLVNIPHSLAITDVPKEWRGIQSKVFREMFKARYSMFKAQRSPVLFDVQDVLRGRERKPIHILTLSQGANRFENSDILRSVIVNIIKLLLHAISRKFKPASSSNSGSTTNNVIMTKVQ